MSPMDTKPSRIPDDLWHDIDHVQSQLAHFWREARTAAHTEEVIGRARVSVTYYEWLCSITVAVDALKLVRRIAPDVPLPSFPSRPRRSSRGSPISE
jgi:hypothetical protein